MLRTRKPGPEAVANERTREMAEAPRKAIAIDERREWLETDGLGGFASGTTSLLRTRRYHALLLAATQPPGGRFVLVNGCDAWLETPQGRFPLNPQRYAPDVVSEAGRQAVVSFTGDPWPRWRLRAGGIDVEHELFVPRGAPVVALSWRLATARATPVRLCVRPFFSGRDYHALHHENPTFQLAPERSGERLVWRPYPGVPGTIALASGELDAEPLWYRRFRYAAERERGLDDTEDLAAPGVFRFDLTRGEAVLILAAEGTASLAMLGTRGAAACRAELAARERARRSGFRSRLERAADQYLVARGTGQTIVAGYPWFTDWGRDTFIAMRGLCLATGRLDDAGAILTQWAGAVSDGMLPNWFPDGGSAPEYNSVDAALWYVVAVHDYLSARGASVPAAERAALTRAVLAIVEGYARGTRHGIRMDEDGLLQAGAPGQQLTWMDARVDGREVTPRIGKPVEVEALWLNALWIASRTLGAAQWRAPFERGLAALRERFWNEHAQCLYDVIDAGHRRGAVEASVRPNQIFTVGGLPLALLEGDRARRVVDAVEARLLTPLGLRSLAPGEPGYAGHYEGGVAQRDGSYHQGTVWPWLMGAFVAAWLHVRGDGASARGEARERFLGPLRAHLDEAGLDHVSEIADGEPPHAARGCPFQAWSVGELLRIEKMLEIGAEPPHPRRS